MQSCTSCTIRCKNRNHHCTFRCYSHTPIHQNKAHTCNADMKKYMLAVVGCHTTIKRINQRKTNSTMIKLLKSITKLTIMIIKIDVNWQLMKDKLDNVISNANNYKSSNQIVMQWPRKQQQQQQQHHECAHRNQKQINKANWLNLKCTYQIIYWRVQKSIIKLNRWNNSIHWLLTSHSRETLTDKNTEYKLSHQVIFVWPNH